MRSFLASWRTALRVARREARRSKGRSAMVIAMIGLPVLALAFAASSYDMFTLTPAEKVTQIMGTADARISWPSNTAIQQGYTGDNGYSATAMASPDGKKTDEFNPTTADLQSKLPAGSRVIPLSRGTAQVKTLGGAGRSDIDAVAVDATDPLTRGYVTVLSGRAPTAPNEVAVSPQAATRLETSVGGTVTLGDASAQYTVVGTVEFPSRLDPTLLFSPSGAPNGKHGGNFSAQWLVDTPTPIDWAGVQQLNTSGILVESAAVRIHPPSAPDPMGSIDGGIRVPVVGTPELSFAVLIAGLAILEIVLMAGPAFAVGARRRQRQLALVAANGGTAAHVRRIVLADGVVLGLLGAVAGITAGVAAAFLGRPYLEELLVHARAGGYRVLPLAQLAIVAFAVGTGLLAALVPAFVTARQNVVTALLGRRGVTRSRKRWIAVGVVMIGTGTLIVIAGTLKVDANIMLAGLILGELGLTLCTPALVGLVARVGRALPLAPRVALRDAARNRAAAAPAISAVMAAVAGSVAIGLFLGSQSDRDRTAYVQSLPLGYVSVHLNRGPDQPNPTADVESAARATLPVTDIAHINAATCPAGVPEGSFCMIQPVLPESERCPYVPQSFMDGVGSGELSPADQRAARADRRCDANRHEINGGFTGDGVTVDDGTDLATLTGAPDAQLAAAKAMLLSGGAVVTDPRYLVDGQVSVKVVLLKADAKSDPGDFQQRVANSPVVKVNAYAMTGAAGAGMIVPPSLVATWGLAPQLSSLVIATSRMPNTDERDRFQAAINDLGVYGEVEAGPPSNRDALGLVLAGVSALITLSAAGIATGLAAADGRADLSALASVGASPRLRRGLSLSQSGVIAGMGSLLGALAGFGAAFAILFALNRRYVDIWPAPLNYPLAIPWWNLVVALLIVPGIAMLGAGLLTRSRLPIERRIG